MLPGANTATSQLRPRHKPTAMRSPEETGPSRGVRGSDPEGRNDRQLLRSGSPTTDAFLIQNQIFKLACLPTIRLPPKAGPCAKRPGGLFGLEDLRNKSFGLTSELCVVDVTAEPGMGKLRTGPKCPTCAKACDFIRRTQRRLSTGYHDPLAKLCEKAPRTYRTHYLNNDDSAFIGSIR